MSFITDVLHIVIKQEPLALVDTLAFLLCKTTNQTLLTDDYFWKKKYQCYFPDSYTEKSTAPIKSLNWKNEFNLEFSSEYEFDGSELSIEEKQHLRTLFTLVNDGYLERIDKLTFDHLLPKLLKTKTKSGKNIIETAAALAKKTGSVASQKILDHLINSLMHHDDPESLAISILNNASLPIIRKHATQKRIMAIERRDSEYINDWGPLQYAAWTNRTDIIRLLIEQKANKDFNVVTPSMAGTPLLVAVRGNNLEAVETLLEYGANAHISMRCEDEYQGMLPIHLAVHFEYKNIVEALIKKTNTIDEYISFGFTPLQMATYNQSIDIINLLIENHAKVVIYSNKAKRKIHNNALYTAVLTENIRIVRMLLGYSISTNRRVIIPKKTIQLYLIGDDIYFETTIHKSIKITNLLDQHTEAIKTVLKNSKTQQLNLEQFAAIYKATKIYNCTPFLNGSDNSIKASEPDYTPLHKAALIGDIEIVNLLLQHQADINALTFSSDSAMELALSNKKYDTVNFLFKNGAKISWVKYYHNVNDQMSLFIKLCQLIHNINELQIGTTDTTYNNMTHRLQDKTKNIHLTYDGNDEKTKQLIQYLEEDYYLIKQLNDFFCKQPEWVLHAAINKENPKRHQASQRIEEFIETVCRKKMSLTSLVRHIKMIYRFDSLKDTFSSISKYWQPSSQGHELTMAAYKKIDTAYKSYLDTPISDLVEINFDTKAPMFTLTAIAEQFRNEYLKFSHQCLNDHSSKMISQAEELIASMTAILYDTNPIEGIWKQLTNIINLIEKINATSEQPALKNRVQKLDELKLAAYQLGEIYSGHSFDIIEKKIQELTKKYAAFELINNFHKELISFRIRNHNVNLNEKEHTLKHLDDLINEAYQGEFPDKKLIEAIEAFKQLELIIETLSPITYLGDNNEDYLENLRHLSTLIESAYKSYRNITSDFQDLNTSIIKQAKDTFSAIKKTYETKYSNSSSLYLWFFKNVKKKKNPDEELIIQITNAQNKLDHLKIKH